MQRGKLHRIVMVLIVSVMGLFSITSHADTSTAKKGADTNAAMTRISEQTQALEKQMQSLQVQLQQLKRQQAQLIAQSPSSKTSAKPTHVATASTPVASKTRTPATATPNPNEAQSHHSPQHGKPDGDVLRANPAGTPGSQTSTAENTARWLDIRGTTVVTSPYFGPQPQFDGSDMLVTKSSVNKDLVLLQMRQQIDNQLTAADKDLERYSVIALSGELEGAATASRRYTKSHSSDLNLTAAEIDLSALVYPWLLGYVTLEYDDTPLPSAVDGSGRRENNSDVDLGQAFMTVGNLNRSPIYFSLGQMYAPFGQYTSYMYSDSLPKVLGRAKIRTAVLGYNDVSNEGLYTSVYTFSGDSRISKNRNIDEGGFNLGYRYKHDLFKATASVSLISNIADSGSMQDNGIDDNNQFQGFGENSSTERIKHRVPGFDTQGNVSYGAFTVLGEYTGATRSFAATDMTFNGHGASPKAMHVEGAYNFALYNRPGSFAVGYDHSWQALALNLPRNRFISSVGYSVWRNTLASFEFKHDINYSGNDTAGGSIAGAGPEVLLTPAGSTSNTFTLVLDYFF